MPKEDVVETEIMEEVVGDAASAAKSKETSLKLRNAKEFPRDGQNKISDQENESPSGGETPPLAWGSSR